MALVKCPECNQDVSDTAEPCPHFCYRLKKAAPRPTYSYYNRRASDIVERDHNLKHIGGVIAGIISIIFGIIFFFMLNLPEAKAYHEVAVAFVISAIVMILVGVGVIAYSAYRLRNY